VISSLDSQMVTVSQNAHTRLRAGGRAGVRACLGLALSWPYMLECAVQV
jgi:hypothetical protein